MSQQQLSEHLRLFVGCALEPQWVESLHPTVKKLKIRLNEREIQCSWTLPENYHLTLSFLGQIQRELVPQIQQELTQQATIAAPFTLRTLGLGAFPDKWAARVIFVDVARSQPLLTLQGALEQRLEEAGFRVAEDRAYHPHITLAQLRNARSTKSILDPWLRKDLGRLTVDRLTLFHSRQVGPYRKYEALSEHPLLGSLAPEAAEP